jgi:hypothetical protein
MRKRYFARVAALAIGAAAGAFPAAAQDQAVDLELVLAIDVSQSVDQYEGYLQREGYIQAFLDPRVAAAISQGTLGRIAVTYVEWAGPSLWRTVVGWTLLSNAEDARSLAAALNSTPVARGTGTSITSVLGFATTLFDGNGFIGERQVIDISGDGPNSSGGNIALARDAVVAAGFTINGVAINNFDGSNFSLPDLDRYYEECVIGGMNSFVLSVDSFESFGEAILRKLILEIAELGPPMPLQPGAEGAPVIPAQLDGFTRPLPRTGELKYAPACDIGERMRLRDNPNALP